MSHDNKAFKIATIKSAKDGEPAVQSFTISELAQKVRTPRIMLREYTAYHHHKAEEKRLSVEARVAKDCGDIELAKQLKAEAQFFKQQQSDAKDGPAFMPYHFKNDLTFKTATDGYRTRDNSRITHFSMLMLDIESQITPDEIHTVLQDFEYFLWPTISHRPNDPRFRVILFCAEPIKPANAVALNARIDAHLPARNDVGKKTQAIDPACLDERGRLMYLPAWLHKHPQKYFFTHNPGRLITIADFALSSSMEQAVQERASLGERSRKETVKTHQTQLATQSADHATVIERKGRFYLNPNGYLETGEGWVRVSDIHHKISNVSCPVHGDTNGSEFAALSKTTDNVYLSCKHCGTIWADTHIENTSQLVLKKASEKRTLISAPQTARTEITFDTLGTPAPQEIENPVQDQIYAVRRWDDVARSWGPQTTTYFLGRRPPVPPEPAAVATLLTDTGTPVTYLNERYLPAELHTLFPETGIAIIKSPKGTGKTTALSPFVQACKDQKHSVLLIGHRVNLLRELSERLGLDYYLDLDGDKVSQHMAICMDSLVRFDPELSKAPHTVIIDESEQVFRHLASSTLRGRRTPVFNSLIWAVRNATRVILLDADMTTSMSLDMLIMLRGHHRVKNEPHDGIINKYVFENRTTTMYESSHQLLGEAVFAARNGGKIFLSTNRKANGANVIAQVFRALGKNVLLVSADTTVTDPRVIEFMRNTTEESKKYDVIVCTPTVQTGVSIDNDHFTHVYGIFYGNVGTYQDIDQAMSRVRRVDNHRVWIQSINHVAEPKTEEEIYNSVQAIEKHGARKVIHGEDATWNFTKGEMLWTEIYARIMFLTQEWSRDLLPQFIQLRTETGYAFDVVGFDEGLFKYGKGLFDAAAAIPQTGYSEELWTTPDIDPQTYEELKAKRKRSPEEHRAVERFEYQKTLGTTWSREVLDRAVNQDLLRMTRKLDKLVNWSFDQHLAYDESSRTHNAITFTDASHLTVNVGLLNLACESMGLTLHDLVASAKATATGVGPEIEITTQQLTALAEVFEQNKTEFTRYANCRIKDPTDIKNLKKVYTALFGKFLPLRTSRVRENGERIPRHYINWKNVDLFLQYFDLA